MNNNRKKETPTSKKNNKSDNKKESESVSSSHAVRETVESIVVAVVLAFLFRAFVAEAFVIPTGSMAPTLMGNHKDLACPKCGHTFQSGASDRAGPVSVVTCPICRFETTAATGELDFASGEYRYELTDADYQTYTGDRILVSKFAYDLTDPKRWDVFVFKFPGNAKQNYIKRLVGLPNETLQIFHGDIYTKAEGESEFNIARKPPRKIVAMLQTVDDTHHVADDLIQAGWPLRWQPIEEGNASGTSATDWATVEDEPTPVTYRHSGETPGVEWLAYRHFIPSEENWRTALQGGRLRRRDATTSLITDYYAYNDVVSAQPSNHSNPFWVGDLAVEVELEIESDSGAIQLMLVEGGTKYLCRIDVSTGEAKLSIDGGAKSFTAIDGTAATTPAAKTPLDGSGSYQIRFANVDGELRLWIDEDVVEFDGPTTYQHHPDPSVLPQSTATDVGDMAPVRFGTKGAAIHIERLRVLRDIYYVASYNISGRMQQDDYDQGRYDATPHDAAIVMTNPLLWGSTNVFSSRRPATFELGEDQFFPCGDNSPSSLDARTWQSRYPANPPPPFVERDLLTGKAVYIYWPHMKRSPFPFTPNFGRMKLIR